MTRASRVPLGHAAKAYKNVGDTDIDGQTIGKGEEGYCYLWYKGLQILGGQKSINARLYLQRPSFEKDRLLRAGRGKEVVIHNDRRS